MLQIHPSILKDLNAATSLDELKSFLQNAIELEYATIPPYLTAELSIKQGTNAEIRKILHSVVIEEMLHFMIACNILNAIGGSPNIFQANFVPSYPTHLPMSIRGSLIVSLEKYSIELVEKVFMEIEEPENPIEFPTALLDVEGLVEPTFATIGQFYRSIQQKIQELADEELPGNPKLQVVSDFFDAEELFPIHTKADAVKAIEIIVEQGEGTDKLPTDQDDDLAHYYLFKQLFVGKKLIKTGPNPGDFSFTGAPIAFDEGSIIPLFPNAKTKDLPEGSEAKNLAEDFSKSYSQLLNELHRAFNGEPALLSESISTMFTLRGIGGRLVPLPHPTQGGFNLGPTFEFFPT
jgi:rubrerythrin